jgi:cation transport ATPase
MISTFLVSKTDCMTCNNQVLKSLDTLKGVFGAEMDRIDGNIVVSHTDEITRKEIGRTLASLGFHEIMEDFEETQYTEQETDEPSIRGCSL